MIASRHPNHARAPAGCRCLVLGDSTPHRENYPTRDAVSQRDGAGRIVKGPRSSARARDQRQWAGDGRLEDTWRGENGLPAS